VDKFKKKAGADSVSGNPKHLFDSHLITPTKQLFDPNDQTTQPTNPQPKEDPLLDSAAQAPASQP
jgi:hypothetical protein